MLFMFFVLAFIGVIKISEIGGGITDRASLLRQLGRSSEMLVLKEEEVNLTSLRMSIQKRSQHSVCLKFFFLSWCKQFCFRFSMNFSLKFHDIACNGSSIGIFFLFSLLREVCYDSMMLCCFIHEFS